MMLTQNIIIIIIIYWWRAECEPNFQQRWLIKQILCKIFNQHLYALLKSLRVIYEYLKIPSAARIPEAAEPTIPRLIPEPSPAT